MGAEADIESDLSAIHRIDDPGHEDAHRVLRLVYRLSYYQGAVRAQVLAAHRDAEKERARREQEEAEARSLAAVAARRGPRNGSAWSFSTS